MVNRPFIRWLNKEISKRKLSMRQFCQQAGIHYTTMRRWYSEGNEPSLESIARLASFVGVDQRLILELLGRVDSTSDIKVTAEEIAWLKLWRSLNTRERAQLRQFIAIVREEPEEEQEEKPRPLPGRKSPNVPEK